MDYGSNYGFSKYGLGIVCKVEEDMLGQKKMSSYLPKALISAAVLWE